MVLFPVLGKRPGGSERTSAFFVERFVETIIIGHREGRKDREIPRPPFFSPLQVFAYASGHHSLFTHFGNQNALVVAVKGVI